MNTIYSCKCSFHHELYVSVLPKTPSYIFSNLEQGPKLHNR